MTVTAVDGPVVDIDAELAMKFERLDPEAALQPCDGHASGGISAVVKITKGVLELLLCGHCARPWGYEHTAHVQPENRQQGSDH